MARYTCYGLRATDKRGEQMRLSTVIEGIGLVMMWVGMSAMDSVNLVIPFVLAFGGIALMFAGASMEARYED